jgi:hypothetical protein
MYFVNQRLNSRDLSFGFLVSVMNSREEGCIDTLRTRIRRGLQARVLQGYSSGGRCFSSSLEPPQSEPRREAKLGIVASEGETVGRIHVDFARGVSAPDIAQSLNDEQVPAPRNANAVGAERSGWTARHVYAVLRQQRYRGNVLWGRTRTKRHPWSGKYVACPLPESEVVRVPAPALAIVDADVAKLVDDRLTSMSRERKSRV